VLGVTACEREQPLEGLPNHAFFILLHFLVVMDLIFRASRRIGRPVNLHLLRDLPSIIFWMPQMPIEKKKEKASINEPINKAPLDRTRQG